MRMEKIQQIAANRLYIAGQQHQFLQKSPYFIFSYKNSLMCMKNCGSMVCISAVQTDKRPPRHSGESPYGAPKV